MSSTDQAGEHAMTVPGLTPEQFYKLREQIEGIYNTVDTAERALRFLREHRAEEIGEGLAVLDLSLGALRSALAREEESFAMLNGCRACEDLGNDDQS